jgi:hypothetical protein
MSQSVQMQSTQVTVKTATQQVYVLTEGGGDRKRPQAGSTKLIDSNNIKIYYNAEIKDISCCTKLWLCCHPCYCGSTFDVERSYLYIRENSLEGNVATKSCLCGKQDLTFVDYFDRDPYKPSKRCLCIPTQPKLEVMKGGCLICCVKCSCCSDDSVVVMPYEKCCCCSNRVGCCDNCCGLCGPITGNPKVTASFEPQPKDAASFVAAAQMIMSRN